MDWNNTILAIILGFVLRFGLPVSITILLIWWFSRLDEGWKKEAEQALGVGSRPLPGNPGCWKLQECPPENRKNCRAFAHPDQPCWQVFRAQDGRLLDRCLGCQVFQTAPLPA